MLVIGISGGLGTGKSTVTRMLRELGAHTIDADQLAHAAMAPGTPGWRRIRRGFGPRVLTRTGAVDRRALAGVVFRDRQQLARLNGIIHPIVIRDIKRRLTQWRRRAPQSIVAIEAPLLVEVGLQGLVDRVVVVTATRAQQIARVQRATGRSRAEIIRRMQAQLPL